MTPDDDTLSDGQRDALATLDQIAEVSRGALTIERPVDIAPGVMTVRVWLSASDNLPTGLFA